MQTNKIIHAPFAIGVLVFALLLLPETRVFSFGFFNSTTGMKLLVSMVELLFALAILTDERVARVTIRSMPVGYLLGAWISWSIVATLFAEHSAAAVVRQAEWLAHGLFAFSLWRFLYTYPQHVRSVFRLLPLGFLLYIIFFAWIAMAFILEPSTYPWATGIPGFSHIRHLGHYAMVALVFSALPLLQPGGRFRYAGILYSLSAMTVAWTVLFWSGGRGPLIALTVSLLLLLVLGRVPAKKGLAAAFLVTAACGALLSSPFQLSGLGLERILGTMVNEGAADGYFSGRLALWSDSLSYIAQHPLLGAGPDGYLFEAASTGRYLHPHNLALQAMLEWGIPGALLLFSLLYLMLRHASERHRAEPEDHARMLALWSVLAMLLLSLVSGTLYFPFSTLLFLIGLAVALQPGKENGERVRVAGDPHPESTGFVLTALSLSSLVFLLHGLSLYALLKDDVPEPESLRVRYLQAFPSGLSHEGAKDKLGKWAVVWWRGGEGEVQQWLQWGASNARNIRRAELPAHGPSRDDYPARRLQEGSSLKLRRSDATLPRRLD